MDLDKPIAFGIFMWNSTERRMNRYGAFYLDTKNFKNTTNVEVVFKAFELMKLLGERVNVKCRIVENRQSDHVGDDFLDIRPSMPEVGEIIDLGVGILALETIEYLENTTAIVIRPNDGRSQLWLDPNVLYRLHDQTVEVFVEQTDLPFNSPPVCKPVHEGVLAKDSGLQVKDFSGKKTKIKTSPRLNDIGDGLFIVSTEYELKD